MHLFFIKVGWLGAHLVLIRRRPSLVKSIDEEVLVLCFVLRERGRGRKGGGRLVNEPGLSDAAVLAVSRVLERAVVLIL